VIAHGSGQINKHGFPILYSGNNKHTNGVGIILAPDIPKNILEFRAIISERVLLVKIKNVH